MSWAYYIKSGPEPDCESARAVCHYRQQDPRTPGIWNPLPDFDTVRQDHQLGDIRDTSSFYSDVRHGHLPAVSWIVPDGDISEHPTSSIRVGEAYVTSLVNAIARSREWTSTAIFITWDGWGGFYDNVAPPRVDQYGYGFRVPGLLVSAYARRGFIDHQQLSFDAFCQVHRGRLPGRRAPGPQDRWAPRPQTHGSRCTARVGRPPTRVRLPAAPTRSARPGPESAGGARSHGDLRAQPDLIARRRRSALRLR